MKKIKMDVRLEMKLEDVSDEEIISSLEMIKSVINEKISDNIINIDILSELVEEQYKSKKYSRIMGEY